MKKNLIKTLMALALPLSVVAVAHAQEKFDATEKVRPAEQPRQLPPNARLQRIKVGEVLEVLSVPVKFFSTKDEKAFYLPPEGNAVLQVIVEQKSGTKTYFVKGLAAGETVGGVVDRSSLDDKGYRPKNEAEHARIQKAVKSAPFVFVIE